MVNAARSVLVFQRMNKEVAQEFQIPECDRKRFFSVYDDKNNKAPAASRAEWYEFVGIGLGHGDDTGPEDNIGAVQRWQAPDEFGGVDRTSVGWGKSVSVRVAHGGPRTIKKKNNTHKKDSLSKRK